MDFRPSTTDPTALAAYVALFRDCFPSAAHLDSHYLLWLYAGNPAGRVVGMDAWDGERLAAHYVCIPAKARFQGLDCRVLLSLNTATHPDYQGRGLFTRLAELTYSAGAEAGFSAVYGVANANSTPGFVRKLGFNLVAALDARVGIGRIDDEDPSKQQAQAEFHRVWTSEALRWRCANPARPFRIHRPLPGLLAASAPTGKPGLRAWAELPDIDGVSPTSFPPPAIRLHLGLRPKRLGARRWTWIDIPDRFRASPLNLIFRSLVAPADSPRSDAVYFGLLDFDAF